MKDFKREYYKNLKKDFDEKIEKSAIFTYIRDEYEKDIDTREAGDDKRNYIKLRRLQLRYDRGEIDIPEFMEGYIRIKLNMPKINMEKDKAGVVYGNRKTMARVKNRQLIRRGFDRLEDELAAGKRKTNDKFKALLKAAGEDKELFDRTVRECFLHDLEASVRIIIPSQYIHTTSGGGIYLERNTYICSLLCVQDVQKLCALLLQPVLISLWLNN